MGSGDTAAKGTCIMGMQIGMAKAVASAIGTGGGAAAGCGCFGVRGLCCLFCFGTAETASPASFKAFLNAAKWMAASSAVSKRPGSASCLRFLSPPRPSPGTCSLAWNLFLTLMTLTKPVLDQGDF